MTLKKDPFTLFKSAWWLKSPHLQTIYPALFRKISSPSDIRRERIKTPDNDFLDIDWCGKAEQPLVILIHGLGGSSESGYIVGLQRNLKVQGFRSVALNFRGCSGESNDLARCYHSGETEDIDFLYRTIRAREATIPIAVVGFSLGGNVLLKWLGEQRNNITLFSAVAVSVPLVLGVCATKLDQGFSKVYRGSLIKELKQYLVIKQAHLVKIGELNEADKVINLGDLSKVKSFWQYDDQVVARLHGFKGADDYYEKSSARQFLKYISVPTLIIQSKDDPFMTEDVIPQQNELSAAVKLEVTENGGHVGFITGKNPFKPQYWLDSRIPHFLREQLIE